MLGELQASVTGVQEEGRVVEDEEGAAMMRVVSFPLEERVVSRARREVEDAALVEVIGIEVTIVLSMVVGVPPGLAVTVTVIVTVTGWNC